MIPLVIGSAFLFVAVFGAVTFTRNQEAINRGSQLEQSQAEMRKCMDALKQAKFAEAEEAARKAVGLMPELPTPYLFLAKSLSEQGTADRLREAVEAYTLCLEKDPDREDQFLGHYGRGQAWLRLGEYRKAEEDFTETLKIKRHFAGAYQDRAFVRKKLGDAEGAKLDAKRAHELSLSPE